MINFKTLFGGFFYAFIIVRFRHFEAHFCHFVLSSLRSGLSECSINY